MPLGNHFAVSQSLDSPDFELDLDPLFNRKTISSTPTTNSLVSVSLSTDKDRKSLPTSLRIETTPQDVLEEVLRRASARTTPIDSESSISDNILDPGAEERLMLQVSRSRTNSLSDSRTKSLSTPPRSRATSANTSPANSRSSSIAPRSRASSIARSRGNSVSPLTSEMTDRRKRSASNASAISSITDGSYGSSEGRVDWDQLEQTDFVRHTGNNDDDETTLLLARLEQANNAIATDPKSGIKTRAKTQARPPSIVELQKLVSEKGARSVRFSILPSAAPMTELDFWAALVRDYPQTVQRLPTITANKIRSGVPAPLRGVVWVSMAGARDRALEATFDRLVNQPSEYEQLIGVDVGRSFPNHELFKDPNGDGQRMLARVLKCYSLYDDEIGYCQGLGFLVGPLLMNMGDKEAFCVLVKLMGDYDLRACFLPDLSGLHLRIFQFKSLLKRHIPKVAAHLEELQVEGEYLSQWFLSFFAVTCPLPLLFRIYDVLFAEGASETIMRVALAIVQRNERKILAYDEFDDVMQLLLSRQLWDVYGLSGASADQFVQSFISFTHLVTRESLDGIDAEFRQRQQNGNRRPSVPNTSNAATRFLGRLWAGGAKAQPISVFSQPTRQTSLSPDDVPSNSFRPKTLLRQNSKSSLNTISSNDATSETSAIISANTSSTALTDFSYSANSDQSSIRAIKSSDTIPRLSRNTSTKERELEAQIEGLLTMISEMQKNQASLETQLQKTTEDWGEDTVAIKTFIDQVKADISTSSTSIQRKGFSSRRASESNSAQSEKPQSLSQTSLRLLHSLDRRYTMRNSRRSTDLVTKEELRLTLAATKDQLQSQTHINQDLAHQLQTKEQEAMVLRNELSTARSRIKDSHSEKQRLEKSLLEMKQVQKKQSNSRPISRYNTIEEQPEAEDNASIKSGSTNGLRELRLGRNSLTRSNNSSASTSSSSSTTPIFSKRTSSLGLSSGATSIAGTSVPSSAQPSPVRESAPSILSSLSNLPSLVNSSSSTPFSSNPPSLASSRAPTSAVIQTLRSAAVSETSLTAPENDTLLLELATAKTSEAVARQELDELKTKFDQMRRMIGGVVGSFPVSPQATPSEKPNPFSVRSISSTFSSVGQSPSETPLTSNTSGSSGQPAMGSIGGFWWGRK